MPNLFEGYKIVILDSTFFSANFTQEFKDGLSKTKVYVSSTFNTEIEEYRQVLSVEQKKIYSENFDYINKNIILKTMNLNSAEGKGDRLNNDIWGLINLMVELNKEFNAKIAIITANRVLMQKIVLKDIHVDYYDLNKQMFIYQSKYSSMCNSFSFREVTSTEGQTEVRVTTGVTVYLSNNKNMVLGDEITSGLEATIYSIKDDNSLIAKVFKKDKLSASKLKNIHSISRINDDLKIDWAKFPLEVVYFDSTCKIPIGFIEQRIIARSNLDENSLYLGDPLSIEEEYLNKKISYSLDICLKVVRQVCYLNSYGFFISDFNMGNFAFSDLSSDMIQMWDTDSFGYQNFFGRYFSPEYTECKNHLPYDISKKEGAIAISEDALHQFVFKVLALGDSPISEYKKTFKYDNDDYTNVIRRSFFPINVWDYLVDVFRGNKEPSSETLLYELSVALKRLKQYPNEDKTVKQLFIDVIPGYLDALNGNVSTSNETEPVKIKKHPIRTLLKVLIWAIIGYCLYAWIAWHELPWETAAWNYIFSNNAQSESSIGNDEISQASPKNENYDYSFSDDKSNYEAYDSKITMNENKIELKVSESREYTVTYSDEIPTEYSYMLDGFGLGADVNRICR